MKITSAEPLKHTSLHQASSTEPCGTDAVVRGTSNRDTNKSHNPLHRIGSVQPVRATAPLFRTNSSSQPSHIETNAAVTTLIPQNKAGFSSITISSKKVSRSSSLPGSNSCTSSSPSSESTSPLPQAHQPMDPNSRHVTMQRKATIVKVTEQRVTSSHVPSTTSTATPPASHAVDTVVHRRKATIIKVTERRESYSPATARSGTRHPEYRHSYTEGVLKDNKTWSQGSYSQHTAVPSYHQSDSTKRPNSAVAPNMATPDPEKNGGTLHRSTLSLFVSNPPAITAPAPSEVSLRAVGQRSERPRRPLSCYGNVFVHTEPSKENVTQPAARKWSFGPPQETNFNPVNSDISFIRPGTALKKGGQLVADTLKPNRGEIEISPLPEDKARRASPSLTLIKAPDPHSHQTPEEVLALNAAAIIANIKLQRQLSAKKTAKGNSEDSIAPTQGNNDACVKPCPDQSPVQQCNRPHAAFVPLSVNPRGAPEMVSLQEALQRSRPDFIIRSQRRVQELERKAQERKQQANSAHPQSQTTVKHKEALSTRTAPLNDNLFKPRDKVITGKEMHLRSKRTPFWYNTTTEVRRKKDEEKNKEASLSNRQRVELFKKLLDQILQRHNN
uniref:ALMS motif domain-containing protein n=1 Tax=Echeneis naucrates TaxID=173247 RepID=A0A665WNI5_ECHNA